MADEIGELAPGDAGQSTYLFALGAHDAHAVLRRRRRAPRGDESAAPPRPRPRRAGAGCGAAVTLVPRCGAFSLDNPSVAHFGGCPVCSWTVALEQGTTAKALDLFAPASLVDEPVLQRLLPGKPGLLRELLIAILTAADDDDFVDPHRAQLLAHATAHAPQIQRSQACVDRECDHDRGADGRCCTPDAALVCATCSIRSGGWDGEYEGAYASECTVAAPCDALRALCDHYGIEIPRPEPALGEAGETTYLIGLDADQQTHAVRASAAGVLPGTGRVADRRPADAICGVATTALVDCDAFDLDNPDVGRPALCPFCTWTVALEQDRAAAALDLFAPEAPVDEHVLQRLLPGNPGLLRELCTKILAEEGESGLGVQLLAHATAHAPQIAEPEACKDGECDHERGADGWCSGPDDELTCVTCSVRGGAWAGEWVNMYAMQCTVAGPCEVLRVLCRHYEVEVPPRAAASS